MNKLPEDHIRHIRYLLETVERGEIYGSPVVDRSSGMSKTEIGNRLKNILMHLYKHLERVTSDDFVAAGLSGIDAIYATQTIDAISAITIDCDEKFVLQLAEQLDSYIGDMSENDICNLLKNDSFQGEEIDVFGLIQTLKSMLSQYYNKSINITENVSVTNIVQDLLGVMNTWSEKTTLMESSQKIYVNTCIDDILAILINNGIKVEKI